MEILSWMGKLSIDMEDAIKESFQEFCENENKGNASWKFQSITLLAEQEIDEDNAQIISVPEPYQTEPHGSDPCPMNHPSWQFYHSLGD